MHKNMTEGYHSCRKIWGVPQNVQKLRPKTEQFKAI